VQFEKDNTDPFNVDQFLNEVATTVNKRYGVQELESRAPKRARVDEDDD
jgi:SNW domain-containing protein 1